MIVIFFIFCRFERYVSECYKNHLKKEGRPEQLLLADMDVEEALDMLSAQGKWSKCLDLARPHGQVVFHKYIALYATDLLRVGIGNTMKIDKSMYLSINNNSDLLILIMYTNIFIIFIYRHNINSEN